MASSPLIFPRAALVLASLLGLLGRVHAQEPAIPPEIAIVQRIGQCLAAGNEFVMSPAPDCVRRGRGDKIAEAANMPLGADDWRATCRNAQDPRRLPGNTIKLLAANHRDIAPTGIRIIGAVFCDGLDLAGLDLPYSLVLDRSLFAGSINGRNLRVKGDVSLENAVLLRTLVLTRAHIEGSIYTSASFMRDLTVTDTQVQGTWLLRNAIVYGDASLFRLSVAGDLSWAKSAFSRLWLQSSDVAGTLDLNDSEARCAYHIRASQVGYLRASHAGFGGMRTAQADGSSIDYAWWRRAVAAGPPKPYTQELFASPLIAGIVAAEHADIAEKAKKPPPGPLVGCESTSGSPFPEFYVFDSTVRTAFCLTGFEWMAPKAALPDETHPTSILALDGSTVRGSLILDFGEADGAARPGTPAYEAVKWTRKFEAVGLTATALFFDFSEREQPYFTFLDGLKFDRIHKAQPSCSPETEHAEHQDAGVGLASQPELPSVDDVMRWLEKNNAPSSQPFLVFVEAFEKAGEDASNLRIRRKTMDMCERVVRWVPLAAPLCPGRGTKAAAGETSIVSDVADLVGTGAQLILWAVADHGLRPGKVVWAVLAVLLAFWAWFWLKLRIVGFDPKGGDTSGDKSGDAPPGQRPAWPIGFLFLFDRLIPLYRIREEHYAIARYYRLATRRELADPGAGRPPWPMRYWGGKFLVAPADEAAAANAEKWLLVLRVIGGGLTVFLLAAINSLTR